MTPRKLSLTKFVAATLVGVTTLALAILGIAGYRAEARRQRGALADLTRVQADELAVALDDPIWNIDRPQIENVLAAMSRAQAIYGIRVTAGGGTYGRRRKDDWSMGPWTADALPAGMLKETRTIRFDGNPIGTVELFVTQKFVDHDLSIVMIEAAASVVAVNLLIIVSVYLVLWRAVLRPITDLERYAGAVPLANDTSAPPAVKGSAAELESLRSSIESMVSLLQLREERFRSIFESVNDVIFIINPETGAILDVNARVTEMFGYTREEARDADIGTISAGHAPYTLPYGVARIRGIPTGEQQLFEWRARHKDGHVFWVEVSLRVATIGGNTRVVSVVRDIDERKAMEEALRRSETMSMMGSLVAGVAHEVRNPLFGIAAALDAFEAEFGGGDDVAEYLTTLRNDVSRLTRLMNGLLDYGRPHPLDRHRQSIRPVIAEALRVCGARAKEKRVDIRQDVDHDLPDVSIDADRILQVLKNVIENAVEFSREGDAVTLRVRKEVNGAASLVCTISDHGPGFREDDLAHVFEPFFTRRPGGSGLGLAIVQKIVSDHGGTIAARNGDAGGGVVEMRLPV